MAVRAIRGWWLPIVLAIAMVLYQANRIEWVQRAMGDAFPVVTGLVITSAEPTIVDGANGVMLAGDANKLRNCTYQGLVWYLGGAYGVPITARFLDRPAVNGIGHLSWQAIVVGITPDRLFETYGEVIHSCLGVIVRTPFYVGQGA